MLFDETGFGIIFSKLPHSKVFPPIKLKLSGMIIHRRKTQHTKDGVDIIIVMDSINSFVGSDFLGHPVFKSEDCLVLVLGNIRRVAALASTLALFPQTCPKAYGAHFG